MPLASSVILLVFAQILCIYMNCLLVLHRENVQRILRNNFLLYVWVFFPNKFRSGVYMINTMFVQFLFRVTTMKKTSMQLTDFTEKAYKYLCINRNYNK